MEEEAFSYFSEILKNLKSYIFKNIANISSTYVIQKQVIQKWVRKQFLRKITPLFSFHFLKMHNSVKFTYSVILVLRMLLLKYL